MKKKSGKVKYLSFKLINNINIPRKIRKYYKHKFINLVI